MTSRPEAHIIVFCQRVSSFVALLGFESCLVILALCAKVLVARTAAEILPHTQSCQGLGGQMLEVWGAEAGDWGSDAGG